MAQKKAFVRYAQNKAVPGSLIVRTKAPKVGTWKEVPYDICCDNIIGETLRLVSSTASVPTAFWTLYGKYSESIIPPFSSEYTTYSFTDGLSAAFNTLQEWVNFANQVYSYIGIFSINPENPNQLFLDIKLSVLKTMCPAEDGSTAFFYLGAA
jgi:hypothetical protein